MTSTRPSQKRPAWIWPLPSKTLSENMIESILTRLGLGSRPEPTLASLRRIYSLWGRRVPFDNVRKLIHVRSGAEGPLPGNTPSDFFTAWLKHGTGGTCWAGSGALYALLHALGFQASRGVATMLVNPDLPPNHGSVLVTINDARYIVDSGILCDEPLALENNETVVGHPAWGVRAYLNDDRWHVNWRPLHKPDGFECRFERFGATSDEFSTFHSQTRGWSPFNFELYARLNRGDDVTGLAFGQAVTLHGEGRISQSPATHEDRVRVLVEDLGMSEEIASQLPHDIPTPPPPGSKTEQQQSFVNG
ncbi:MAG TPA: arylamine N-acetyltransferase [Verrucomicrobiales bacterium]|nr:arylamine N-acetyltransferase [Verrucomicrobiales bacterium]